MHHFLYFLCFDLQVLGPKYHPLKPGSWRHASPLGDDWIAPPPHANGEQQNAADAKTLPCWTRRPGSEKRGGISADSEKDGTEIETEEGTGGSVALFMMMGAALQPVSRVPAGNVLALAGLEGRVNKCATLSDTPECPAMRAVTLQVGAVGQFQLQRPD